MKKLVVVRRHNYICEYKNWQTLSDVCVKHQESHGHGGVGFCWRKWLESNASDEEKEGLMFNIAERLKYTVMPKSDWIKLRKEKKLVTNLAVWGA